MLKYKVIKLFILNVLLSSYTGSCFAGIWDIIALNPEQQKNYISHSIDAFFHIKNVCLDKDKNKINHVFSPFGLDTCIAAYGQTLYTETKQQFNDKLISLGINPDMPLSSADKSKLQFLTVILTRNEVTKAGRNKLDVLNVFLGEYLLQKTNNTFSDENKNTLDNLRQSFKEEIKHTLEQKFKGNLKLDYKTLWSPLTNDDAYLKVVSAIKFQDKWRGKPFVNIGLDTFYTSDNRQILTDFIEKTIIDSPVIDDNSNWRAVRTFYEQSYAIDIILPVENDKSTDEEKKQIIYSLINMLNENKCYNTRDTTIIMPKFEYKQQNHLSSYLANNLKGINLDHRNFLKNTDDIDFLEALQECYLKVDEKGTVAEAITEISGGYGCIRPTPIEFLVNRPYYLVISEYTINRMSRDPTKIKSIIMMAEVGSPIE